jgi:hypothetical protein
MATRISLRDNLVGCSNSDPQSHDDVGLQGRVDNS